MSYELSDLCIGIDKESLRSKREIPKVATEAFFNTLCQYIEELNEQGKTIMEDPVGYLEIIHGKDIYVDQIQEIRKELEKRGIRWVYYPAIDSPYCYTKESTCVEWG